MMRSRAPALLGSLVLAGVAALDGVAAQRPGTPAAPARFGINLSGAEARGTDALRPTLADFRKAIEQQGFALIRYPFKRDRLTPARIREVRTLTDYARGRGVPVILDNHSFNWRPPADQIAWWAGVASQFPDDGSVLLDLNNEPQGIRWMQWAVDAKQIVAGLRARGIRHPILLEWPGYSSISRFDKHEPAGRPCSSAACALDRTPGAIDPLGLTFLNGHRYFDADGSGTKAECLTDKGKPRTESGFDKFAARLRKRGMKGYITEAAFGGIVGIPASCAAVGADAVADLRANGDVLLGVTWWGGGRLWPDRYPFKIDCPKGEAVCRSAYLGAIRPRGR